MKTVIDIACLVFLIIILGGLLLFGMFDVWLMTLELETMLERTIEAF